ncbi:hypothetical protein [Dendronalium phyllosphericum]|nr:hypothetical protein [Dendronalium phyllosphericum]
MFGEDIKIYSRSHIRTVAIAKSHKATGFLLSTHNSTLCHII